MQPPHTRPRPGTSHSKRATFWCVTNVASALLALATARRVSSVFDSYAMTHFRSKRDDLWRNTQRFVEGKDAFRPLVVNTRRNTFLFFQRSLSNSLCLQPDVAVHYPVYRCFDPIISDFNPVCYQCNLKNAHFLHPVLCWLSFCPTFCVFNSLPVEKITLQQIKH